MKRINYFTYHGCSFDGNERQNSPAADAKTDYIIEVLNRIGYGVNLHSMAPVSRNRVSPSFSYHKDANSYHYFASFGLGNNSFVRVLCRWFMQFQLFVWCLTHLKHEEQILVYHSLGYDYIFIILKRILRLRIIGEIEEIYQDVHRQRHFLERNEFRFIEICSKFIFPNNVLSLRLKVGVRPFIVVHGTYRISPRLEGTLSDGLTHIIYAGTFDSVKGGAIMAIKTAEFLPNNYHLHIAGFGSSENVSKVLSEIDRVNALFQCRITYHGHVSRSELKTIYDCCSIGLCTQNPNVLLNYTSFPSKILEYMANGLVVISGKNNVIEGSAVGKYVYYYEEQDPRCIADLIMSINESNSPKSELILKELDKQFSVDLEKLMLC